MSGAAAALRAMVEVVATTTLPVETRRQARLIFTDTIGAMAAGVGEPECRRLLDRADPPGPCTVIGRREACAPERAAFINGLLGTAAELDEGHYVAGGHPAVHAIPAALAVGEAADASGAEVLDAITVGYEVAARLGAATRLRDSVHSHGTWGGVAAAAAVARLRGCNADGMLAAVNVAAHLAIAASRTSGQRGASIRNVFAGLAARHGILACDLVEAGFTAEPDAIAIVFGAILGTDFGPMAMLDGLGEDWRVGSNFFKLSASCRETHGPLSAWSDLVIGHAAGAGAPSVDSLAAITVRTFDAAARLGERYPTTGLAARYSIPFTLASHIVHGHTGPEAFRGEALGDLRVRHVASLVSLEESPTMTAALPHRLTEVIVTLRNGQVLRGTSDGSPGDPTQPLPESDLQDKFLRCGRPLWGDAVGEVWAACDGLGGGRAVRALTALLRTRLISPAR